MVVQGTGWWWWWWCVGGWVAAAEEHDTFPICVVRSAQTVRCGEKRSPTAVNSGNNEGPEPECDSQVKQTGSVNLFHHV